MRQGRVRYARNGDIHLAYRVLGEGETPLVFVPGFISNVDLYDDPANPFGLLIEQLARQTRLILWDKRGTGLSDPVNGVPTLDERMDDLQAVLQSAEVHRPALLGISEGGPMSLLFAATFPDRVQSMVLYGTAARFTQELPDFPWGFHPISYCNMDLRSSKTTGEKEYRRKHFSARPANAGGARDDRSLRTSRCQPSYGGNVGEGDGRDRCARHSAHR